MALQFVGAQGLEAAALLVAAVEQAVDVLLHEALAAAHGLGVAEQEQDARLRQQLARSDGLQQAVEQFDRRRLVAVNAGRQQQVEAAVVVGGRRHFQHTLGQPVQARALAGQLNLLGRLAAGQGQFKQFSEGEHGNSFFLSTRALKAGG